jgi:hypothetical protein
MAALLDKFMKFYGNGTKQIGRNFCIPASLCNAVRIFGVTDCIQEKVRDAWYAEQRKAIESSLDDQMDGANIAIFETMERNFEGMKRIDNAHFSCPEDDNVLFLSNADSAVDFIERHTGQDHAVIVSTWNRFFNGDHFEIKGYHMWLVLDFDRATNKVVFHDSAPDAICEMAITDSKSMLLRGEEHQVDMGLRGCITHSDYTCLALWRVES